MLRRGGWLLLPILACGLGCVPAAGGSLLGVLALLMLTLGAVSSARAGAPLQCDGDETPYCDKGRIRQNCCPKNADCNFKSPPFTDCGDGWCVEGFDRGRCPAPEPYVTECRSPDATVCLAKKVTKACIMPVPTNYMGPSRNPHYRTCGDGTRCTTSPFYEDCFPKRGVLTSCDGQWTKVCLGGKVEERCLPKGPLTQFEATRYATCKDGGCAVGTEHNCWPR